MRRLRGFVLALAVLAQLVVAPPAGAQRFVLIVSQSSGTSANHDAGGGIDAPFPASASSGGRFVAFTSAASNLLGATGTDDNDSADVFIRDTASPLSPPTLVSASAGLCSSLICSADGESTSPSISGNGRYVAFASTATDLVDPPFLGGGWQVYVRDLVARTTDRIPIEDADEGLYTEALAPSISDAGSRVAFTGRGPDIATQVLAYTRSPLGDGTFDLVSVADGEIGARDSDSSRLSGDGALVAFRSSDRCLIHPPQPCDQDGVSDIFVRDLTAETTTRVAGYDADSSAPSLSRNGRYVAFESNATSIPGGQTDGRTSVYRHDRITGVTLLVAPGVGGPADGDSTSPSVSDDGAVAFQSEATNLVAGDANGKVDVFSFQDGTGVTLRSVTQDLLQPAGNSFAAALSPEGGTVTFVSESPLIDTDTNDVNDVFATSMCTGASRDVQDALTTATGDAAGHLGAGLLAVCSAPPAADGLTSVWDAVSIAEGSLL